MQITVKGKNIDVTDSLRSHATSKLSKAERYSDAVMNAEWILTVERNWHIAEVTIHGKDLNLHFEERSKDMYNSIDRVVEKLERQLKKQREKVSSYRGGRGDVALEEAPGHNENHKKKDDQDKYSARIEGVSRFVPHAMTTDEAIKEMESEGHDFLCFVNEDNGRLSIVHKKGRGYEILEPRVK